MKQPYRHRLNRREFLNLPGFHAGAYVVAHVQGTSGHALEMHEGWERPYNPEPRVVLAIADCETSINLEFDTSSAHQRMNSFHKIDTLIAALEAFKAGIEEEECVLYKPCARQLDRPAAS